MREEEYDKLGYFLTMSNFELRIIVEMNNLDRLRVRKSRETESNTERWICETLTDAKSVHRQDEISDRRI